MPALGDGADPVGAPAAPTDSPHVVPADDAKPATSGIGAKARRGLRWSLVGTLVARIGSFSLGLVLARLLSPEDFGVYAIAAAAMAFVMHVNDVGLIAATVQWRGRLEEMAPTASVMAVIFSVATYIALFFAAPVIADVANVPQATNVIRLLTAGVLIDGVTAVRSAALMRNFRQDQLIRANIAGLAANAAVAISIGLMGGGAYAFAGGLLAGTFVTGVLVFVWAKLPIAVGFDRAIARRLVAFGVPLAASLGVEAVLMNADYIIVGNLVGAQQLGFYLLAFNVSTWALGIITTAVRYVSVAGFSRLSEVDTETLAAGVRRSMPMLLTVLVPITALIAVLATPLIDFLYNSGDEPGKWLAAAPVLPYLMVLTLVRAIASFGIDILMGAGATRSTLWINLSWAVVLIPALIVGTRVGGITGAGISHAMVGLIVVVPITFVALHRIGIKTRTIAPPLVRPLVGGVVAALVAYVGAQIAGPHSALQLAVGTAVGAGVYVIVGVPRQDLRRYVAILRREPTGDATA